MTGVPKSNNKGMHHMPRIQYVKNGIKMAQQRTMSYISGMVSHLQMQMKEKRYPSTGQHTKGVYRDTIEVYLSPPELISLLGHPPVCVTHHGNQQV